jgi:hypothetical protein
MGEDGAGGDVLMYAPRQLYPPPPEGRGIARVLITLPSEYHSRRTLGSLFEMHHLLPEQRLDILYQRFRWGDLQTFLG